MLLSSAVLEITECGTRYLHADKASNHAEHDVDPVSIAHCCHIVAQHQCGEGIFKLAERQARASCAFGPTDKLS